MSRLATFKGAGMTPAVSGKEEGFFSWRRLLRATRGWGMAAAVAAVVVVGGAGEGKRGGERGGLPWEGSIPSVVFDS